MAPRDDEGPHPATHAGRRIDETPSAERRDEPAFVDELLDDRSADRACRPTKSGPEGWAFTILLIMPLAVAIALLIGTGTLPTPAIGVFAMIVAIPVVMLWLVVRLLWEPFRRRFPATHPTDRVRWKRLQIVRLGLLGGFNHCVDVGADDEHVHLRLMMPIGLFARPMSISRSAMEWEGGERPKSIFGMGRVRIAGKRCLIPAWAFADQTGSGEGTRQS